MCNLFVTNLSDVRDREGKILKKQLELIGLLSMKEAMLLKAEGNSPKRKELKYWKNLWWKSLREIIKTAFSDKISLNIYLKQIRVKFLRQSSNNTYDL